MATNPFTLIPGIWQRLTDKGQSGTIWIKSNVQFSVLIDHVIVPGIPVDTFAEGSEIETSVGISVIKSFAISIAAPITISADNSDDVYYALYKSTNIKNSAIAVVDIS